MKNALKGIKGKLVGTMMVGALVVGGAAASASEFSDGAVGQKASQLIGWANGVLGGQLEANGEKKEAEVKTHVTNEFNRAATAVAGEYSAQYNRGVNEVNTYATSYKADVTAFANEQTDAAKNAFKATTDTKVSEAKSEINQTARAEALRLMGN